MGFIQPWLKKIRNNMIFKYEVIDEVQNSSNNKYEVTRRVWDQKRDEKPSLPRLWHKTPELFVDLDQLAILKAIFEIFWLHTQSPFSQINSL